MRALAYELRRLFGIRSSRLLLLATLAAAAATSAVTARHADAGTLPAAQAVRMLTAAVPGLALPVAALGAGILGALSYGREARHPAFRATLVPTGRRLRLLGAKLTVVGSVSVLTALAAVVTDAVVLRFTLPGDVRHDRVQSADHLLPALLGYGVLVLAAAWTALLAAALLRSAVGGILVLLTLPAAAEPALHTLLGRSGAAWAEHLSALLPFRSGSGWVYGAAHSTRVHLTAGYVAPVAVVLIPAGVLLVACVAVTLRRRTV